MPNSMTGFGTAETVAGPFHVNWEIRSVNNRFLDLSMRLPDELRSLETELRESIKARISRGKVDCMLRVVSTESEAARRRMNPDVLASLKAWQAALAKDWPDAAPLGIVDLLRWPGVLEEPERGLDALAEPLRQSFVAAVEVLSEARRREGERITELLKQRLEAIRGLMNEIQPRLAGASERHRDKLLERLVKLDVQAEPQRLEQELALIAQRLDVTEESDRLVGHVTEIEDVLGRDEPIGRRLDFLIQELNREANTLASKAQDEDLVRCAVDLKVLIEQLREQVQNLE
jgi:uncharacterized protein (TIGR00255 family)